MAKLRVTLLATMVAGLIGMADMAHARTLKYAVGFPAGVPVVEAQTYADAVKEYSNGELEVKVYGMSLLNLAETAAGLTQRIADIGMVLPPYSPKAFPRFNMLAEASMSLGLRSESDDRAGMAMAGALMEYIFLECPECLEEFDKQSHVFTGGFASPAYNLQCTKPIFTVEELKGARIRTGGAAWAKWVQSMGAAPISLTGNEMLEGLKQNVIDCTALNVPELVNSNLVGAVTDITTGVPGGSFPVSTTSINKSVWQSLTNQQRESLLRAGSLGSAAMAFGFYKSAMDIRMDPSKYKVKFHEADEKLLEKSHEMIRKSLAELPDNYEKEYNIKNGQEMVEKIQNLLNKWVEYVEDVDSKESLSDLYWNKIFVNVDPKKYGMN